MVGLLDVQGIASRPPAPVEPFRTTPRQIAVNAPGLNLPGGGGGGGAKAPAPRTREQQMIDFLNAKEAQQKDQERTAVTNLGAQARAAGAGLQSVPAEIAQAVRAAPSDYDGGRILSAYNAERFALAETKRQKELDFRRDMAKAEAGREVKRQRPLTDEERAQYPNLDKNKAYQIDELGKITAPGGAGVNVEVSTGEIAKPTWAATEKGMQSALQSLDVLAGVDASYDPSFSTLPTQIGVTVDKWADRWGFALSEEDAARLIAWEDWAAGTYSLLNSYINRLSGAATSVQEAERLKKALPTVEDSPRQYQAKLKRFKRDLLYTLQAGAETLDEGNPVRRQAVDDINRLLEEMGDPATQNRPRMLDDDEIDQLPDLQ